MSSYDAGTWEQILKKSSLQFADGEEIDIDGLIFLIGVRELGQPYKRFKKDEKLDVMHIAICRLLQPYGYYKLDGLDDDGWPHYTLVEELPFLKAGEQSVLMKKAIIKYFTEEALL